MLISRKEETKERKRAGKKERTKLAKSPIFSIALITLIHQKTNKNPIITSKRIKRRLYLYQVFVFYDSSAGGWDNWWKTQGIMIHW